VQARGFEIYRLVPGLQVLVPFDRDDVDAYQLNLFAVKPDRAQSLETQGLAIRSLSPGAPGESGVSIDLPSVLGQRPYAEKLVSGWRQRISEDADDVVQELMSGLALYCRAWDESLSMAARFNALREAHSQLSRRQASSTENARLYSLARVAWELGHRERALDALNAICSKLDSGDVLAEWCVASVLDQRARLAAYSSYFQDEGVLGSLEMLRQLPFQCADMERRRQLVRMRLGRQAAPEPTPLLAQRTEDNLNPGFWASAGGSAKEARGVRS
jgi:hypothetical protein